ncbi:MAG: peptidoglycan DD-metalloendopeptidase family protein [Defluviitaleaceae bacterium]|nr:peptidoglycan DD-metalloendopeptidase family protein [Defluviitaleaceae bacterium]
MSRSRTLKNIVFGLILGGLFLGAMIIGGDAQARSIADMNRQQQEMRDERDYLRARLLEAQSEQQHALSEMLILELELFEVSSEFAVAYDSLRYFEELLAQTEAELELAEAQRADRLEILGARIRFLHQNNRLSYIELLLTSQSLTEFANNREHFRRILEHDQEIIEALEILEQEIAQKRDEIDAQRFAIQMHTEELAMTLAELEAVMAVRAIRIEELEANEVYYQQLMAMKDADIAAVTRDINIAQAEADRVLAQQAIAALNANITRNANSDMHWPVARAPFISSGYGWRQRPIGSGTEFHTGIDLPAPFNTPILAADDGVVTFAGWRNGYGNTIVIYHGGGISTLYAHIRTGGILVSVGQTVTRGQHIAGVGSTGLSTGNHLHFEVLRNGNHINPMPFLQ